MLSFKIDPEVIKTGDCSCGANEWKRFISVARPAGKAIDGETRQTEDMCDARWT